MTKNTGLVTIEAKLTFADGETAEVLIAQDLDACWGSTTSIAARTVPIRSAIRERLLEDQLLIADPDDEDDENDQA